MIVNRLLDAFFRTLDAVDAVRDRVDRVLGREPRPDPWAVEWPPAKIEEPSASDTSELARGGTEDAATNGATEKATPAESATSGKSAAGAKKASSKAASTKAASTKASSKASAAKATAKKEAAPKTKPATSTKASRKGSVDRSGKDFDSPRAKAIWEYIHENNLGVVTEEAMLDGKKVLARVVWALSAAEAAGSTLGLTTADASALLHLAAGMEVYATNIGRACRDHVELIEESEPDGRSKRYRLTPKGKSLAVDIPTEKR